MTERDHSQQAAHDEEVFTSDAVAEPEAPSRASFTAQGTIPPPMMTEPGPTERPSASDLAFGGGDNELAEYEQIASIIRNAPAISYDERMELLTELSRLTHHAKPQDAAANAARVDEILARVGLPKMPAHWTSAHKVRFANWIDSQPDKAKLADSWIGHEAIDERDFLAVEPAILELRTMDHQAMFVRQGELMMKMFRGEDVDGSASAEWHANAAKQHPYPRMWSAEKRAKFSRWFEARHPPTPAEIAARRNGYAAQAQYAQQMAAQATAQYQQQQAFFAQQSAAQTKAILDRQAAQQAALQPGTRAAVQVPQQTVQTGDYRALYAGMAPAAPTAGMVPTAGMAPPGGHAPMTSEPQAAAFTNEPTEEPAEVAGVMVQAFSTGAQDPLGDRLKLVTRISPQEISQGMELELASFSPEIRIHPLVFATVKADAKAVVEAVATSSGRFQFSAGAQGSLSLELGVGANRLPMGGLNVRGALTAELAGPVQFTRHANGEWEGVYGIRVQAVGDLIAEVPFKQWVYRVGTLDVGTMTGDGWQWSPAITDFCDRLQAASRLPDDATEEHWAACWDPTKPVPATPRPTPTTAPSTLPPTTATPTATNQQPQPTRGPTPTGQ